MSREEGKKAIDLARGLKEVVERFKKKLGEVGRLVQRVRNAYTLCFDVWWLREDNLTYACAFRKIIAGSPCMLI